MSVYKNVLYMSLTRPLNTVIIYNRHITKELYNGPFENIPKLLFDKEVNVRFYENETKTLKLWICI